MISSHPKSYLSVTCDNQSTVIKLDLKSSIRFIIHKEHRPTECTTKYHSSKRKKSFPANSSESNEQLLICRSESIIAKFVFH